MVVDTLLSSSRDSSLLRLVARAVIVRGVGFQHQFTSTYKQQREIGRAPLHRAMSRSFLKPTKGPKIIDHCSASGRLKTLSK